MIITEKWKKGNVTHRDRRARESAFFAFPFEQNRWLEIVRLVSSSSSSANARALQKSRQKNFKNFTHRTHQFFFSLFLLFGKIREKIASQQNRAKRTRALGLRSVRLLHARDIYKKRETTHLASWIRRLSENGPLQKASRSLEHSLFIVSKSRLKIQKQRERGFIEKRIQKNSRETRDEEELLLNEK